MTQVVAFFFLFHARLIINAPVMLQRRYEAYELFFFFFTKLLRSIFLAKNERGLLLRKPVMMIEVLHFYWVFFSQ